MPDKATGRLFRANTHAQALLGEPRGGSNVEHITTLIPMGRVGKASEVAALVSWHTSDEYSYSTAADYDIRGVRAT